MSCFNDVDLLHDELCKTVLCPFQLLIQIFQKNADHLNNGDDQGSKRYRSQVVSEENNVTVTYILHVQ